MRALHWAATLTPGFEVNHPAQRCGVSYTLSTAPARYNKRMKPGQSQPIAAGKPSKQSAAKRTPRRYLTLTPKTLRIPKHVFELLNSAPLDWTDKRYHAEIRVQRDKLYIRVFSTRREEKHSFPRSIWNFYKHPNGAAEITFASAVKEIPSLRKSMLQRLPLRIYSDIAVVTLKRNPAIQR